MKNYTPNCLIPLRVSMKAWERFIAKISISETGCWMWTAAKDSYGYGRFSVSRKRTLPHRFVYIALRDNIPDGLQIDHLCRNRACCNPGHLEVVTSRENTLRGESLQAQNKRKTHCHKGHEFSHENTKIRAHGARDCRVCNRERDRIRRIRRKCI